MMIKPFMVLYLIVGGFCVTFLRWCLSHCLPFDPHSSTKSTFLTNLMACLLAGFLWKWLPAANQSVKLFWILAFGVSFSTFASLGFELFTYLQHNKYKLALANGLSSFVLGITLVWFGQRLLDCC